MREHRQLRRPQPLSAITHQPSRGLAAAAPGSALAGLIVSDIEAAHRELVGRGIDASDVWHGPPFPRGPPTQRRSRAHQLGTAQRRENQRRASIGVVCRTRGESDGLSRRGGLAQAGRARGRDSHRRPGPGSTAPAVRPSRPQECLQTGTPLRSGPRGPLRRGRHEGHARRSHRPRARSDHLRPPRRSTACRTGPALALPGCDRQQRRMTPECRATAVEHTAQRSALAGRGARDRRAQVEHLHDLSGWSLMHKMLFGSEYR